MANICQPLFSSNSVFWPQFLQLRCCRLSQVPLLTFRETFERFWNIVLKNLMHFSLHRHRHRHRHRHKTFSIFHFHFHNGNLWFAWKVRGTILEGVFNSTNEGATFPGFANKMVLEEAQSSEHGNARSCPL